MKKLQPYITKSIALLLLAVMTQTYVCAGLCAAGTYSCCTTMKKEHDCCKKAKHGDNNHAESPKRNCQNEHLAFFATIGQFHANDEVAIDPPLQHDIAFFSLPDYTGRLAIATPAATYTGFRPPPPDSDLLVRIQLFRI